MPSYKQSFVELGVLQRVDVFRKVKEKPKRCYSILFIVYYYSRDFQNKKIRKKKNLLSLI